MPKTASKTKAPRKVKVAAKRIVPAKPDPNDSRRTDISAEMSRATDELARLQQERLVVEAKLAAHTGIFGSGFLKMRDPKNEQLLQDIDALIAEQERNYSESRKALESLKSLIVQ